MQSIRVLLSLLAVAAACACSHVSVTRVDASHPYQDGVRFYRPWPYLLVSVDKNDARQAQIVYLPDLSEEYVIQPKVRLGSVDAKATLEEGWKLTSFGASADPQIAETLDALSGLIGAASAVGVAPPGGAAAFPLPPGLYRLTYTAGHASGVERVELTAP